MGKGSKRRPMNISEDQYTENYERAFGRRKEINDCIRCGRPMKRDEDFCSRCASEILADEHEER